MNNNIYKFSISSFLLGTVFTISILGIVREFSFWTDQNPNVTSAINSIKNIQIIKAVNASELYSEFVCPCCGKPLDPENICCGAMKQRIDFIDSLIKEGGSKEDIELAAVKEWGLSSLIKSEKQDEIKTKLLENAPEDSPRIEFIKSSYDFGEISQSEGIVSTEVRFVNSGKSDLVIDKLSSSCGCTSGAIVYKGKEGPSFTMPGHGKKNPENWSVSITPGDEAILKIYYDPNAHGKQDKAVLPITRTVSVFSNDPVNFEVKTKIELEQIP